MKAIANIVLVVGVCLATCGAAGFHNPDLTGRVENSGLKTEKAAWPLFVVGMFVVAAGGVIDRKARRGAGAGDKQSGAAGLDSIKDVLMRIRDAVAEIDWQKDELTGEQLCQKIDEIISGDFFDLVDKREDMLAMLGFANYARVWEHVAVAERLLARVWSIATDGFRDQAIEDLPRAHECLEDAVEAIGALAKRSA